jgi:ADP-heptose:LPS heptosyltransferase
LPEQGIGDEVMFSSVLHELESLKKNSLQIKITLVCDKRLVDLYNRSFKFLTAIPKDPEHSYHHLDNEIDYWIFNGSLPKFFRLTCEDFDAPIPYLRANENCYKEWKKRYSLLNHTINIGISWRGGLAAKSRADRSLDLDQLLPVLTKASQNANLINLQYGEHTSEIEEFTKRSGIPIHDWEDSNPLKDVESFIAQIKALDLVLTIDNSTAHFAGALGKKTHLMLPFDQDWRWGEESTNSYWYSKNLTLFRQKSLGNWSTVIQSIREALD